MSLKQISKILFYISALALITVAYKIFSYRINDFTNYSRVYGLKQISRSELKTAINFYDLRNKYFYQINPHDLSNALSTRPLIKKIKVRTSIYPNINYKIFIVEYNPWAIYKRQIISDEARVIIKSKNEAKLYNSKAVTEIYKHSDKLITIKTNKKISPDQIKNLKRLSEQVQDNLDKVGKSEQIRKIFLDKENNLFFYTDSLTFKFGTFDSRIFNRSKKLDSLFNKMKTLSAELEYIDLSLSSNEILLGKRNQVKPIRDLKQPEVQSNNNHE